MLDTNSKSKLTGGTGKNLGDAVLIVTGVCTLIAIIATIVAIWLQTKNYRKPLLQRYVIRIMILVPIFSTASWASLVSLKASSWIDPFRDVYEAFVIYAFFQLLINFIGGERALIILMHGRAPVAHPWPLNKMFNKVDISDPHTFLAIKRGILQYTWIKPMLAVATIIMKATNTYQNGYAGIKSGYIWSGVVYNISITISLYALAMFWVCMSVDLKPFRPMPKFLCIKGIIFASYWQGFMLSIFVALGFVSSKVPGYTPDNLAAAIQDALICIEMPLFAIAQWYAFSWKDYADVTISAARMPVKYAIRDACGIVDLIQDAKETLGGSHYEYRNYDAGDNTLAHEESAQRNARLMEGMRYERNGKGKYWIPKPGHVDSKTPLLQENGNHAGRSTSSSKERGTTVKYGTTGSHTPEEPELNEDDERLFVNARALEFGDWNYPVITAHNATREDTLYSDPRMVTSSTSRHILHPTKANERRRKSQIQKIQDSADKGKHRSDSSSSAGDEASGASKVKEAFKKIFSTAEPSPGNDKDQLVDLVIEDGAAEEVERVRARKEGSPVWNKHDPKHYVQAYSDSEEGEVVREGHEPASESNDNPTQQHAVGLDFETEGASKDNDEDEPEKASQWKGRDYGGKESPNDRTHAFEDGEANVWNSPSR